MARRKTNVFSLSFIDCMCCGFGAVILFFMIINRGSTVHSEVVLEELRAEASKLEEEVLVGRKDLFAVRNALTELEQEKVAAEGRSDRIIQIIEQKKIELAEMRDDTVASEEHLAKLKADLESLEQELKRLEGASLSQEEQGEALRTFIGEGDRQYLTGLKVGGDHILILVDASTSMLDSTIVNIVRRRHLPVYEKLRAKKWRQVVDTVDWLTTQIPAASQFQIYAFNVGSWALLDDTEGQWLEASKQGTLDRALANLREVVPDRGTSLHAAFRSVAVLDPPPDNVYLLTDGLPTQADKPPGRLTVSSRDRTKFFSKAVEILPPRIPVNVILYPIEGDPNAAIVFWQLALATGGSFMSPAADWP